MTSHGSLYTVRTAENACIDVEANDSRTLVSWKMAGLVGGSVMVWGGIAHRLKTPLIVVNGNLNAIQFRDRILRQCVVPFVQRHNLTFQQDNARPHVARVCRDFLTQNNVIPLDWPPYSPGLPP